MAEQKYKLIIVESPSKGKTFEKYLGAGYKVIASYGHIKDLPKKSLGVDLNTFDMEIVPMEGKEGKIKDIINMAKNAEEIYLASDADREGETISFHLKDVVKRKDVKRILFNAVTKKAILDAIANPVPLNQPKYEAQQARRILDRLIGYKISPLLWSKVQSGLSAGRVQSVALKIIVKRDEEIKNFVPEHWFDIMAKVSLTNDVIVNSKYYGNDITKPAIEIKNKIDAENIVADIKNEKFKVYDLIKKLKTNNTQAPYTTSKLQQEASSKLGISPKDTMAIAQKLYEGIEISNGVGRTGLITYMRTDSVRSEPQAITAVRDYIKDLYGDDYLSKDIIYHTQKKADSKVQDAHEAIRPTNLSLAPQKIRGDLNHEQFLIYQLIWNKFIASQMSPNIQEVTTITFNVKEKYFFKTNGTVEKFDGFKKVFSFKNKDNKEDEDTSLPIVNQGEEFVQSKDAEILAKTSNPPPRFTESTLVKELEEKGIGRPSTFVSITNNIKDRQYVELTKEKEPKYIPTELGIKLSNMLEKYFPQQMDIAFSSKIEDFLDDIEEGKIKYKDMLKEFWKQFSEELKKVETELPTINFGKPKVIDPKSRSGIKCLDCTDGEYIIKKNSSNNSEFLSCSNYPNCKSTKNMERDKKGVVKLIEGFKKNYSSEVCQKCGKRMTIIELPNKEPFLSCEDYPNCKNTMPMPSKVECPKCKLGKLVPRKTKAGDTFYGCSKYPACDFVIWDEVVFKKCKSCGFGLLIKNSKQKTKYCYSCNAEQK